MKYYIKRYCAPEDEALRFLNSNARTFYSNNDDFEDIDYGVYLKVSLLTALIDLERTIRGTFNCDIFLKNGKASVLKTMFPNACKMFSINSDEDVIRLGRFLEDLRNINAHAFLCKDDFSIFKTDFSFLQYEKKMNPNIVYYDGQVTMAGIVFIILNFLREESIATLAKSDFLISLISSGKYSADDGGKFVNQISKVNLEIPIRQTRGNDIFTSIFSDCLEDVSQEGTKFSCKIGSPNYPIFKVDGEISKNIVTIKKGSITKAYYENDYKLEIENVKRFVEFSSKLPTMVFIDYLYLKGITVFSDKVARDIANNFEFISKLNKPKFYVNKNIKILLLPKSISDFTLCSSIISDNLNLIFLLFENYTIKTRHYNREEKYSSINTALKILGIPNELIYEIKYLRNLVAHGYILEEHMSYKDEDRKFTTNYLISVLNKLLIFLKDSCFDTYKNLQHFISINLVNKVMSGKYKKIVDSSRNNLPSFPIYSKEEMKIKGDFVKHSYFDLTDFDIFYCDKNNKNRILRIEIEGCADTFYLNDCSSDLSLIDNVASKNNFRIAVEKTNSLIVDYKLLKA